MKGILIYTALLFIFSEISHAQTSASFTVGGDFDKFYPVTWDDPGWSNSVPTKLQIGRSNVHTNSTLRGALIAEFSYHISIWGHGSNFIDASIRNSVTNFIAGWRDASTGGSSSCIIIWLRGGGTTYQYMSNLPVTHVVYDGASNPLPFQEHNGPAHSFKTSVDNYVNSDGISNSSSAFFSGGRLTSLMEMLE